MPISELIKLIIDFVDFVNFLRHKFYVYLFRTRHRGAMSDFGKNGEENDNTLSKKVLNSMVKALFLANVLRIVRNFAPRFRKNTNYHE